MKEFRSFTKEITAVSRMFYRYCDIRVQPTHFQPSKSLNGKCKSETHQLKSQSRRLTENSLSLKYSARIETWHPNLLIINSKFISQQLISLRRYQRMVEKNEKTKEQIRKRDEKRKLLIQQQLMERQAQVELARAENRNSSLGVQQRGMESSGSLPQLKKTRVRTHQAPRQVNKKLSLTESTKTQDEKSLPRVNSNESEKVEGKS